METVEGFHLGKYRSVGLNGLMRVEFRQSLE